MLSIGVTFFLYICLWIYCIYLPCQTCCWSRSRRWAGVRESLLLQNAAHLDYICSQTALHGLGPQSVRRQRKRRRLVTCCVHQLHQLVIYWVPCKDFFFVSVSTCPKFAHFVSISTADIVKHHYHCAQHLSLKDSTLGDPHVWWLQYHLFIHSGLRYVRFFMRACWWLNVQWIKRVWRVSGKVFGTQLTKKKL